MVSELEITLFLFEIGPTLWPQTLGPFLRDRGFFCTPSCPQRKHVVEDDLELPPPEGLGLNSEVSAF